MPEMHLRQLGFIYSACGPFTRIKKETEIYGNGDANYIYNNELDKAWFQHDMTYGKCKHLERITHSDKVLNDKDFAIANNPKYDGRQIRLASMVYKFF